MDEVEEGIEVDMVGGEVVGLAWVRLLVSGGEVSGLRHRVTMVDVVATEEEEADGLTRKKVCLIPLPLSWTCLTPRRDSLSSGSAWTIRTTSRSDVAISR